MHAVTRRARAGFTLIEVLVALVVLSLLLALGVPRMSDWLLASKAGAATEFYAEGFRLARAQAVRHNSASRILLTDNANNGQFDWQVDICFPTAATPCNATSGSWSSTADSAGGDPEKLADPAKLAGFKSVFRAADALPSTTMLAATLTPAGATDIYYTSLGWVDTAFAPRLSQLQLAPAPAHAGAFRPSAIAITLAGTASKCDPGVAAHDSRGCPP